MAKGTFPDARIVIVDDEAANVRLLEVLLQREGYTNLISTTDPREVFTIFDEAEPDLILLDLMMPGLSGFEVMERLGRLIPEGSYLPILVLTADVTPEVKRKALAGEATDFLTKPFDRAEVVLRIRNLLSARYFHLQLRDQNQLLEQRVVERTIELRDAREAALEASRLKTEFLAVMSHEFRTPMSVIIGWTDLLLHTDLNDEQRKSARTVRQSAQHLLTILNDILDFAHIEAGRLRIESNPFDPHALILQASEALQPAAQAKGLRLTTTVAPGVPHQVRGDPRRVHKLLLNLVSNAVKFTHRGEVGLRAEVDEATATRVTLRFAVSDTGIGLSQAALKRLFQPFTQADGSDTRRHGGTGLGLSMCKRLVELMGGKIGVESREGQGSTFWVTVPFAR